MGLLLLGCDDDNRVGRDGSVGDASIDAPSNDADDADAADGTVMRPDTSVDFDATCATAVSEAEVDLRPVDIIWVVDNSTSMEPAIQQVQAGLDGFAELVADSGLDYRVIMLSLRGTSASSRFPICIPMPLAGDSSCGDGERFFHVSVDIQSTQVLEQLIGTLAQSEGFQAGDEKGSDRPWRDLLRPEATKTIVVVTDDNQRTCALPCAGCSCQPSDPPLTATSLEDFPGGGNPFNSTVLGPGILTSTYGDLFEGYTFNGIYGWGSETDPAERCMFPDDSTSDSSGPTYTELVERTGGVRAQICDQSSSAAWDAFFGAVATRVEQTARIDCEIALPPPPDGMLLSPTKVNVLLESDMMSVPFFKVPDADACGPAGGWHYDNEAAPTRIILCPSSCEDAQTTLRESGAAGVNVLFGCDTILI